MRGFGGRCCYTSAAITNRTKAENTNLEKVLSASPAEFYSAQRVKAEIAFIQNNMTIE